MATNKKTYKQLRTDLDSILAWFETDDVDIDQAMDKHAEASKLITQLEKYLASAELKVSKIAAVNTELNAAKNKK